MMDKAKQPLLSNSKGHRDSTINKSSRFPGFGNVVLYILLAPVVIVIVVFFLLSWILLTISGIGPLIHYVLSISDRKRLKREKLLHEHSELLQIEIPGGLNKASNGMKYTIMVRWVKCANSKQPPVIFPNGLAATQLFLARPQDMLKDEGFSSLTFDRLGCGFSDPNITGIAPSAVDICREMNYVMDFILEKEILPIDTKWIAVGGSMGNVVIQAYMTLYPNRFVGLLNLDGFPYPYLCQSKVFIDTFAGQYAMFCRITWTGIFRFVNFLATSTWKKNSESSKFPVATIIAQMNQPSFFGNTVYEFRTMMSCCELAHAGWGNHSILLMEESVRDYLARIAPTESVIFDRRNGVPREVTEERSPSEVSPAWATSDEIQIVRDWFRSRETGTVLLGSDKELQVNFSDRAAFAIAGAFTGGVTGDDDAIRIHPLYPQWQKLVVRNMSCRRYGMAGSMAVSPQLMALSAAEHNQLAAVALDGARTVYPRLEHADGFAQSEEIVRFVMQIAERCSVK